jgi:hypothetical protein
MRVCIALAMSIHAMDSGVQTLEMDSDLLDFDFSIFGMGTSSFSMMMEEGELGEANNTRSENHTPGGMVKALMDAGIMTMDSQDGVLFDEADMSAVCVPDLNSMMVEEANLDKLLPDYQGLRDNLCKAYSNSTRPACCATRCTLSICWNGFGARAATSTQRRRKSNSMAFELGESEQRRRKSKMDLLYGSQTAESKEKSKQDVKGKGNSRGFQGKRLFIVDPQTNIEYKVKVDITASTRKVVACLSPSVGAVQGGDCKTTRECVGAPLKPTHVQKQCTRAERLAKTCDRSLLSPDMTAWDSAFSSQASVKERLTQELNIRAKVLITMLCAAA